MRDKRVRDNESQLYIYFTVFRTVNKMGYPVNFFFTSVGAH